MAERKEGTGEGKENVDDLLNFATLAIDATDEEEENKGNKIVVSQHGEHTPSTGEDALEPAGQEEQLIEPDLSLEPVDPFTLDDEHYLDPFTEEELVSVLQSFEDGNEKQLELPDAGNALPDIDLDLDERDDSLLLPPEDLSAIFNRDSDIIATAGGENINRNSSNDLQTSEPLQESDTSSFIQAIINEEEEKEEAQEEGLTGDKTAAYNDEDDLLEGLQNLHLDWDQDDDDYYYDEIPPYLYCQPCTPTTAESSGFSDQTLPGQISLAGLNRAEDDHRKLPQKDFNSLLQLSLLNSDDIDGDNPLLSESEMDSLFQDNDKEHGVHGENEAGASPENGQANEGTEQHHGEDYSNNSYRPAALREVETLLQSFVVGPSGLKNERSCLGHKETIFGADFSECGKYLATAGQDSTIKIWNVEKNAPLSTLTEHDKEYECLRVAWASSTWARDTISRVHDSSFAFLLATAGADGMVKVWSCKDPSTATWKCCATIDHGSFARKPSNPDDDKDKPQVYALGFISHWKGLPIADEKASQNSFLLTSSDDFVHLWEIEPNCEQSTHDLHLREVMSLHFSAMQDYGYGVSVVQVTSAGMTVDNSEGQQTDDTKASASSKAFGGDRNPSNLNFVFDASYNPTNGLLGVALSDGSLRIMNGRGVCLSILQLPGCQSHLTSFCWDSAGTRLATSVATGHVIIWSLDVGDGKGEATTSCAAVLEGGHQPGRPVFGSSFCGSAEDLLVTWGVDGRLCLWDGYSLGNIEAPIAVLVNNPSYAIYAVDVLPTCIAVAGGGGEASFLGVPVMLYGIQAQQTPLQATKNDE